MLSKQTYKHARSIVASNQLFQQEYQLLSFELLFLTHRVLFSFTIILENCNLQSFKIPVGLW